MRFDILNRLGVDHQCDRQTDRRTDGQPLAIAWSNDPRKVEIISNKITTKCYKL